METLSIKTQKQYKRKKRLQNFKNNIPLHLMVLPAIIFVIIFNYIPLYGLRIAFLDFNPAKGLFGAQKWIGMENFHTLFSLPDFTKIIINTVIIALLKSILGIIVPVIVALLLNAIRCTGLRSGIQTLIYLPHFISWVIIATVLVDILSPSSGIINSAIKAFGLQPIYFLGDNKWIKFTFVVSDVWKEFGYGSIIYFAAIQGIDPSMYEAADIDGASSLKKSWYITIPSIRQIIVLMALLSLGNIISGGFDQVYNLINDATRTNGEILDTFIYDYAFGSATDYGLSTAATIFKSAISFILVSAGYYLSYKFADYQIF